MSFEDNAHRTRYTGYLLPKVEMKGWNFITDAQNLIDQPAKNDTRTYENIQKITTDQGDYPTCCLLDYPYFERDYRLISIDLSKQQVLDADPKAIHQIPLLEI